MCTDFSGALPFDMNTYRKQLAEIEVRRQNQPMTPQEPEALTEQDEREAREAYLQSMRYGR